MRRVAALKDQVASLDPGVFAVVMATGIVSSGMSDLELRPLSTAMFGVAVASMLVLSGTLLWRLLRYLSRALADAQDPDKAFGYFTPVAATNVIALDVVGHHSSTSGVLTLGSATLWLLLIYALPAYLMLARRSRSLLPHVTGGWLLSVVATQSLAASAATLTRPYSHSTSWLGPVAVALWGFGVGLYVILVVLVLIRLLALPVSPGALDPSYWILMGATASSVLAAAKILSMPNNLPVLVVSRGVIAGGSVLLWAVGTWWIPLLLALGGWRYWFRPRPFRYEPGLWSIVFPLGMYAVSGVAFGHVSGLDFIVDAARAETWLGIAAWCVVSLLMILSTLARTRTSE